MGNQLTQCIDLAQSASSVLSPQGKGSSAAASFIGPDTLKKLNVNEEVITEGIKVLSEFILKPKVVVKKPPEPKNPKPFHNFGEHGSGFRAPNSDAIQDFNQLREFCLENGQLFEDKSFPAIGSSLYFSSREGNKFKWMRPKELVDDPKFITEGASRFDVCQGELGDCWLLASVANLTLNEKLFKRVVPHDQSFGSDYAGIFHFRFWQYGKWIDICVDDRLPTINGKLVLMHSKDRNEFWSALLEKAYAKLHGSYEALKGGTVTEALTDFTGGLTEFYEIQSDECPANLFQIMLKAFQRSSFMGCSIDALDASMMESELPNGLIKGHAYSITAVRCVELKTPRVQGKIPLIRIRNPWGNEAEWKGAWGDGSREWSLVSESEKKSLELNFDHDGEFWMTFDDFKSNFTKLEICHLTPEPISDGPNANKKFWNEVQFEGEWVSGVTAGGCRNNLQTFASNPQYIIELKDHDEGDEDDLCTLIVGLMQKNRRAKRKMGLDSLTIGFAVYAIKDGLFSYGDEPAATRGFARRQLLPTEFFKYNSSVARSPTFINLREVSSRMRLPPGQYCIIPSTFDANEEGEFILRIFTERPPTSAEENDDEVGYCPEDIDQQNTIIIDESKDKVAEEDIIRREVKPPSPGPGINNLLGGQDITRYIEIFGTVMTGLRFVLTNCVQAEETQERMQQTAGTKVLSTKTADFFSRIAGEDMEVDAAELQEILNHSLKKEFKFDGFSLDTCRSMIALLDDDRSGKLGLDEFTSLWTKIRHWCDVFKQHDKDLSGTISTGELRSALHETGLSVNRQILILIVHRYGDICGKKHDHSTKHERYLTFDNFIHVCLKLKHSIELWNDSNTQSTRTISKPSGSAASFTLDEWVERVMYC